MVDKNLFLYDLAVVTIMKIDGPYVKEWLDYHLLAGVDHFFIYDNDSTDAYREVVKPYVERGVVTSTRTSVWNGGCPAYTEVVQRFKFFCRYVAFIDSDEFIFPKNGSTIVETLDEIFALNPSAGGLQFNWQCFGSNGQEKADYTRGVLDRFTRRAEKDWYLSPDENRRMWLGNLHVKTVANPRRIDYIPSPHFAIYYPGISVIDENGQAVAPYCFKLPVTAEKIVLNHYWTKSYEEFLIRREGRGQKELFKLFDRNEVFDDGIVKYRDALLGTRGGGTRGALPSQTNQLPATVQRASTKSYADAG